MSMWSRASSAAAGGPIQGLDSPRACADGEQDVDATLEEMPLRQR